MSIELKTIGNTRISMPQALSFVIMSPSERLSQKGATYGPLATSGPRRPILDTLYGLNVARETQKKVQCGPRTKIVAHPWIICMGPL